MEEWEAPPTDPPAAASAMVASKDAEMKIILNVPEQVPLFPLSGQSQTPSSKASTWMDRVPALQNSPVATHRDGGINAVYMLTTADGHPKASSLSTASTTSQHSKRWKDLTRKYVDQHKYRTTMRIYDDHMSLNVKNTELFDLCD